MAECVYKVLQRMIGAAHKRMGRPPKFPADMVHDLYVDIHDKVTAPRPHGYEAAYVRGWIDGWIRCWYWTHARQWSTGNTRPLTKNMVGRWEQAGSGISGDIEIIPDLLQLLSTQERAAVNYAFGLEDGYPKPIKEVAQIFELTAQRVYQIINDALTKMRQAAKMRYDSPLGSMFIQPIDTN